MKALIVINADGGTARSTDLDVFKQHATQTFQENGRHADFLAVQGDELLSALEEAARSGEHDTIIACGGDGTASATAAVCVEHDRIFGLMPAGTLNLYARSLGMSFDLEEACRQLATASVERASIGSANGRYFIHQYSIGLHPRLVREREKIGYSSRFGKMLSGLRAIKNVVTYSKSIRVRSDVFGNRKTNKVSMLNIANNPYGENHLPYADKLNSGKLAAYWLPPMRRSEEIKLISDVLLGKWNANERIKQAFTEEITLDFGRKNGRLRASIDGELCPIEEKVTLKIHKGALKVLVPGNFSENL